MCTVPSSDRRRRFLQYNFMDPGCGGRISYGGGGRPPAPPPPLAPDPSSPKDIAECFLEYR